MLRWRKKYIGWGESEWTATATPQKHGRGFTFAKYTIASWSSELRYVLYADESAGGGPKRTEIGIYASPENAMKAADKRARKLGFVTASENPMAESMPFWSGVGGLGVALIAASGALAGAVLYRKVHST